MAVLTVLEAGKSRIKVSADPLSNEDSFWLVDSHLLIVSMHGIEGK